MAELKKRADISEYWLLQNDMIKSVSVLILKIHQALARTLTVSLVDNITLTTKDRKVGGKIRKNDVFKTVDCPFEN